MLDYQKGKITLPQYKIYRALEEELDRNASHPAVAPIYFPQELARLQTLERDLEHFFGSEWRQRVIVPAATVRYQERIRRIGAESPDLLVAHAYTRYLGDLSGGQVFDDLQKMLSVTTTEAEDQSEGNAVKSNNMFPSLPSMQFTVGVCVALTTVGLGFYAL
ncbi:hypothetical protein F7725_003954 [Dissostichus mawsoni]|uniref:heme oxygenase (biliverdin-producing) n=1 Tax=Dissostichus mawsoni TaxID=36200 RepID=A0A7J5YBN1_DISMA|nr:hypothetical protein F7725_003954 [Dissostichus mawsoni]